MARSIPKKTISKSEIYSRVTAADLAICAVAFLMIVFVVISALPFKFGIVLVISAIAIALVVRVDALPNYIYVMRFMRHFALPHRFARDVSDKLLLDRKESKQKAFGELFADEEELRKQELNRLLSDPNVPAEVKEKIRHHRAQEEQRAQAQPEPEDKMKCSSMEQLCAYTQIDDGLIGYANEYFGAAIELSEIDTPMTENMIDALRQILRMATFCANIVKLEALSEEKNELEPKYYLVLFDKDKALLTGLADHATELLSNAGLNARRLDSQKTAVFLKNSNYMEFDASQIESVAEKDQALWSMPELVKVRSNTVEVNHIVTHNFCAVTYPALVEDGWLAKLFAIPSSKCVLKCRLMDREQAIDALKAETLPSEVTELLTNLEQAQEDVLQVSIYVTAYDRVATEESKKIIEKPPVSLPRILNFKEKIREIFDDEGIVINRMPFNQLHAYLGAQISAKAPGANWMMPSATLAASSPWLRVDRPDIAIAESVDETPVSNIVVLGNLDIEGLEDEEASAESSEETTDADKAPKIELRLPDLIGDSNEKPEYSAAAAEE